MKKMLSIISSVLVLGGMTACGPSEGEGQGEMTSGPCENTLVPIEVEFTLDPENLEGGQATQLTAHVTHDGFDVNDANEVKFEIWEHANPDYYHMLDSENQGGGLFTLDWTFQEEGVYYTYYHVTACSMHRMEKEMIVVGDVDVEAITAEPDTVTTKMNEKKDAEEAHHDAHKQDVPEEKEGQHHDH